MPSVLLNNTITLNDFYKTQSIQRVKEYNGKKRFLNKYFKPEFVKVLMVHFEKFN